jgi:SAM-dependent methyltransferase
MAITEVPIDPERIEACAEQVVSIYNGSMLTYMIDLGHRTGLLAAAAKGPATSVQLAARAGLTERYVREWLGAMTTGGIVDHDPADDTYALPTEFAAVLTAGPLPLAAVAAMHTILGRHVPAVARAFREGGGVPYAAYRPEFTDAMDTIGRVWFDTALVDEFLPLVGLVDQLEAGCRVADFCCGTGHGLVVLARRFPNSTFTGFDLDDGAIARARAEAAGAGVTNVRFEVVDVARLDLQDAFDVVFVFDALHDQVDPAGVLDRVAAALVPGGVFAAREPHGAGDVEGNRHNPMAPSLYGISTLHCMTVSLAHDGAGIGTLLGEDLARELLAAAGFVDITVEPAPGDPIDAVYVCRAPGGE